MSLSASATKVADGLRGPLEALGVDLEDVEIQRAGRRHVLTVVIDRDGGVDLDLVAEVSRTVSETLDETGLGDEIAGAYVLEVTSPGVDRPLTEPRHWRRAIGRLVDVSLTDGTRVTGRVREQGGDGTVVVETDDSEVVIDPAAVSRAVVQVEFTRVDEE